MKDWHHITEQTPDGPVVHLLPSKQAYEQKRDQLTYKKISLWACIKSWFCVMVSK